MNNQRIKLFLMLTLVCLVLFSSNACVVKTQQVQQEPAEASRGEMTLSVVGDGNLSLPQQRELTFGTWGKIAEISVDEGERVTKGQVLARLDTTSLERAIMTAEQAVTIAEQTVTAAGLAIAIAEIDVRKAEDNLRATEIDLKQASDNFRKIAYPYSYSTFAFDVPSAVADIGDAKRQIAEAQQLLKAGTDSDQYQEGLHQLREAQKSLVEAWERLARGQGEDVFVEQFLPVKDFWTLRTAQLSMEKAELALTQAKNNRDKANLALENAKNDRDKSISGLNNAKNGLDTAKDELGKAVIVAPFEGVIAKVSAKPGDRISSVEYANKTIIELVDTNQLELEAEVDEIDIPMVKLGQRAIITIDALPDVKLEGEVLFISPVAMEEAGVVMYKVKIGLDVPEGYALKAGMSASAEIMVD